MRRKIILSIIIVATATTSFLVGKSTAPKKMTVDQQIDFVSTITDWNTDGNELSIFTADSCEFYAYKSTDEYTEKNYIPCNSVVDWEETENGLKITLKDGNIYTWEK